MVPSVAVICLWRAAPASGAEWPHGCEIGPVIGGLISQPCPPGSHAGTGSCRNALLLIATLCVRSIISDILFDIMSV